MSSKILVTSRSALIEKYTRSGFNKIAAAVKVLIAADKRRELDTSLIFLDDPVAMRRHGGKAVTDPKSGQQHKEAIDAIFKSLEPEYLVILDAPDVVPHVSLQNPAPKDDDPDVPSDLPYACEAPFSRDVRKYHSITRVVGRIPGIQHADRPTFLIKLLKASAEFKPRARKDYLAYFALSALVWQKATAKNVDAIFGKNGKIHTSPPIVNSAANRLLSPLTHLINCHGDTVSPNFFGERDGNTDFIALTTEGVARHARAKTVIAAECCYGAELYDPKLQADEKPPIAVSYFQRGAVGFFGSTNVAYGEAATLSAADFMTQYFLVNVLNGASLGRACLEARQKFIDEQYLDIYNLKTVGQFILLGDPSLHPCREDDPDENKRKNLADSSTARRIRRLDLTALGRSKGESAAFSGKKERNPKLARRARSIARKLGVRADNIDTFDLSGGPLYRSSMRSQAIRPQTVIVSQRSRPIVRNVGGKKRTRRDVKAAVIQTHRGGVAHVAHYRSR